MILLNFAQPLPLDQLERLSRLIGQAIDEVRQPAAVSEPAAPIDQQARRLIDALALTPEQWQSAPLVAVLPAPEALALAVLAELHGRMGYFLPIVRLAEHVEVAEVLNLQAIRDAARVQRG